MISNYGFEKLILDNTRRDKNVLKRILYAKDCGLSVFVVYGTGHAIKLEPALREAYGAGS